ncbi:MAG: AcrR family transcriptional regulator [Rhodothermales bacterium]|jgi:AcrR family transcriptional regulator
MVTPAPNNPEGRLALTRDRILVAAVKLADEIGITSLSMRKLGKELGVEAMSLYGYVSNKDAILDGIMDQVVGEITVPEAGGDWKHEIRMRANSARTVLLRHPWATMLIVSRPNVGPAMLRYVDATIGCFCAAGFSYEQADHAWNAIDSHLYGFTLQELNFPFKRGEYAEVAEQLLHLIPADKYPHLNGLSQEIISGRFDGLHDFQLGLNLILDGLERQLEG